MTGQQLLEVLHAMSPEILALDVVVRGVNRPEMEGAGWLGTDLRGYGPYVAVYALDDDVRYIHQPQGRANG